MDPTSIHPEPSPTSAAFASRARALMETMPYLRSLRGAIVVIKYGGAVMGDDDLADWWANDIALLESLRLKPVIVHGGGNALTAMMKKLGITSEFVDGHRVTTPEAARVAEMVLSGSINKEVVSRLQRAGVRAIGLSGSDGGLLTVRPHRPQGRDIGCVGLVETVDREPLDMLLDKAYVPVLSSTAADRLGQPMNINADVVAGAVAAALHAHRLVYLSDTAGLIVGDKLLPLLGVSQARALLADETATGGMRPKLESAIHAIEAGVPSVHLIDGRVRHALLMELLSEQGGGTRLVSDEHAPTRLATDVDTAQAANATTKAPAVAWAGTLSARGAKVIMPTYGRYAIEVAAGEGARVRGADGRSYLDFAAGVAVNALGYAHPAVVAAIRAGSTGVVHASNLYWTEPMVRLAERLTAMSGMDMAFFCNSGTEAIETALKVARKARPGRARTIVFERSFHGRTLGALSATMQPAYQAPFAPLLEGFHAIPFGDFDAAEAAIASDVAAVLVEPIQGEGGLRPVPAGFLSHLRKLCDRSGSLLLVDEVQTGIGRTGKLFACEHDDVRPDAIATAKALAGGLPMGALLTRGDCALALGPGEHGCTFGGGPLIANVAHAVLDIIANAEFLATVRARGERLGAGLGKLHAAHPTLVTEARGRGLMWGLALSAPRASELVARLHELGLLTVPAGKDVLRLVPPLIVTESDIDAAIATLGTALSGLAVA